MARKNKSIIKYNDLNKNITWQYDNSVAIRKLINQKNDWYLKNNVEFLKNWFNNVFYLKTANEFGIQIWSNILNVSLFIPNRPDIIFSLEQKRLICRLRYHQLMNRCTISDINHVMSDLFCNEDNLAYALDSLDMSEVMYVFKYQPEKWLRQILVNYDLLPRPSAVGSKYRIITYVPFGFGKFYSNFGVPFWNGGRLVE